MYAALLARRFAELRRSTWHLVVMRSGLLTMIVLTIVLVALAFGWRAHRLGQFAKLKSELKRGSVPQTPAAARPGGQDAIVLQRAQLSSSTAPEFLSATMLPGRGMRCSFWPRRLLLRQHDCSMEAGWTRRGAEA